MTPPNRQTGEQLPEGEISNRHLALMISQSNRTASETLKIMKDEQLARSALADRVLGLEGRMHSVEQHIANPPSAPSVAPRGLAWLLRARPAFIVSAFVFMALGGTLAIVAGLLVLTRS